ncbi:uncharacterized protein LOC113236695 [Hyposmocoma kahamanoa]|uniref:uncharacterized protein LOC113236695 n=1 Tax=Hyposmocoma kahamanoa TaxID=1477025 RepID=UPI000E6D78ED|nr:uncharacterized protein LOC113236695 [Hyposmocoma kahamanoa]
MLMVGPTARSIREMLVVCEAYAASHGLIYNVKNCEFMIFKAAGRCPETFPSITLNGMSVKQEFRFKYLGHILADVLKDDDDVERERRSLAIHENMLARKFARYADHGK